jgi:hypothetical protein
MSNEFYPTPKEIKETAKDWKPIYNFFAETKNLSPYIKRKLKQQQAEREARLKAQYENFAIGKPV